MSTSTSFGLSKFESQERQGYVIDVRQSQFQVHAFASGLISAIAHSPKFDIREWVGEATLNSGNLTDGTLTATVNPCGLSLVDEVRDRDRREIFRVMQGEVLETDLYPEIVFNASWRMMRQINPDQYQVTTEGSLRLHGVTNRLCFDTQVTLSPNTFRAHGKFTVLQSTFGIKIASIAGSTLRLRDDLVFSFFVLGRKKDKAI